MAVIKGKITLINVNDGSFSGVSIESVNSYYYVSTTGTKPPDEPLYQLVSDSGLLKIQEGASVNFYFKEGMLLASRDGEELGLVVDKDIIIGAGGKWTETIPEVNSGLYLWTKTVTTYTNNTSHVSYLVSRSGLDGIDGQSFVFEANQEEILKFTTRNGNISLSPEMLELRIYKANPSSEEGRTKIEELDITKLSVSVLNKMGGAWVQITDESIQKLISFSDTEPGTLFFNLTEFSKMNEIEESSRIFVEDESVLKFDYIYSEIENEAIKTYNLSSYIYFRYGMNKDMANLSIEANGIVASIQSSALIFNANGLTVNNGAIRILNKKGEAVMISDVDGNLTLTGTVIAKDGEFSGIVYAKGGKFQGIIEAEGGFFRGSLESNSGKIGGFKISENRLVSTDTENSIILDGAAGEIIANNITLGTGARIKDYIQIGDNVFIKNVSSSGGSFITVKDSNQLDILQLRSDGNLIVGNNKSSIVVNGAEGAIYSQNFSNGQGWKISNEESVFNDVTICGSIKASVMEYGAVQAVGGILLVRPSTRILKIEQNPESQTSILFLESINGFEKEDYCLIDDESLQSYYKIVEIILEENKIVLQGLVSETYVSKPIVNFGKKDSVGIGINGSNNNGLIPSHSVSVFDYDGSGKLTPHIILGKLPNEDIYGFAKNTYGLYAENVILKGSLVTQVDLNGASTYSGISTLYDGENSPVSDKYSAWFGENTGEILLWAGAEGTEKEQIENSKFFIDKYGNLFAGSGYFKGTIITDAKISASEIETAKITGIGDQPALTIQDAKQGIVFLGTVNEVDKEIFKLTDELIEANVSNIIFNNSFKIKENGSLILPSLYAVGESLLSQVSEEQPKEVICLSKNKISYSNEFNEGEPLPVSSYIDFSVGLSFSPNGKKVTVDMVEQQTKINNELYLSASVKYNELMEYKPVYSEDELIGYDLYIE